MGHVDKNRAAVFKGLGGASNFLSFISRPVIATLRKLASLLPCRQFCRTVAIRLTNWYSPYAYFQTLEGQQGFASIERYLASDAFLLQSKATDFCFALVDKTVSPRINLTHHDIRILETVGGESLELWWRATKVGDKRMFLLTCHVGDLEKVNALYLPTFTKDRDLLIYHLVERDEPGKGVEWSPSLFHHRHRGIFDTIAIDGYVSRSIRGALASLLSKTATMITCHIYGPMGTGKMTTIACMARFLSFDIYFLHLTSLKSPASLRKFLKETKEMSLVVFDVDMVDYESVSLDSILHFLKSEWYPAGGRLVVFKSQNRIDLLVGKCHLDTPLTYLTPKGFKLMAQIHANRSSGTRYERVLKEIGEVDVTAGEVVELLRCQSDFLRPEPRMQALLTYLEKRPRRIKQLEELADEQFGDSYLGAPSRSNYAVGCL